MESVKKMLLLAGLVLFGGLATGLGSSLMARAAEVEPSPSPKPQGVSFLAPKLQELMKSAMRVVREEEGVVSLTLPGAHSFVDGAPVMFFRKKGQRIEVIATGRVISETRNPKSGVLELQVDLDRDTVIKYPIEGDFGAPLADPNALANGDLMSQNDFLLPEEESSDRVNDRPGYTEFGMGLLLGDLDTTSTTVANLEKRTTQYRFQNQHWAYFSDFFPIGVTSDSHGGRFPTSTYYSNVVTSEEAVSVLGFHYRFPPILGKKLEISGRVDSLSDRFSTDNADENLLTTEVSGMGLGIRARYSFVPLIWKPEKKSLFAFAFQGLTLDASYFPILTAADQGVSRGTSSPGSTGMAVRVSATALAWIDFIPLLKRWFIEGSYGFRSYDLRFSGPVTLESVPVPIPFPEGTRATEREGDFRFVVGVRIEDPIRSLFSGGKKKK
jgi:hypothetical protein